MFCDRMDFEKPKRAPFPVFSGIVRLFEKKIHKGSLQFFDVLQQWMLKNAKGSPFFSAPGARASGHLARQFGCLGFSWVWYSFCLILWVFRHFHVLLLFLSLRYGADLGRSRLVFFSPDHRPYTEMSTFYRTFLGLPTLLASNLWCFQRAPLLVTIVSKAFAVARQKTQKVSVFFGIETFSPKISRCRRKPPPLGYFDFVQQTFDTDFFRYNFHLANEYLLHFDDYFRPAKRVLRTSSFFRH